ncbi:5'-deoxynucleotidase [Entamoeba marina]
MDGIMQFLHLIGDLKNIPRTGWVHNNVPNPESISDHMYRMSIMAMLLAPPTIDKSYAIKMCLCHDMAETIVGDITPMEPVTKEEKFEKESKALDEMCELLPKEIGDDIKKCWLEYEAKETDVAKFCASLDKVEMCLQAQEYENKHQLDLSQFFKSIPITSGDSLKPFFDLVLAKRKEK